MPPVLAETTSEKAGSKSQGIVKKQKMAVKPVNGFSSSEVSIKQTSKVIAYPETNGEGPNDVEEKPASKRSLVKREPSDIFKSFSRPKVSLKHESTGSSTGASPASKTAPTVSMSLLFDCKASNKT